MIPAVSFGLALLAVPGVLRKRFIRLQPRTWSMVTAGSLVLGSGLVGIGLVAMAVPTLLEGLGAHHLAALCRRLIHDLLAGGHVGGIAAAGVFALVGVRAAITTQRLRRARRSAEVEEWIGDHRFATDHELVVIPTDEPVALAPGGDSNQVIVSSGLVKLLTEDELDMVLRHELSHLRRRHHHYVTLAAIIESAFRWFPFAADSAWVLRLGVERWADEEAAGENPRARGVLYAALFAASGCRPRPGLIGFGGTEALIERLHALQSDPATAKFRWWYPGVFGVSMAALAAWFGSIAIVGISMAADPYCFLQA